MEELGFDDFLKHSHQGSRGKKLQGWHDKGSVNIVLHPKASIIAFAKHNIPDVIDFKDKDTKQSTRKVWQQTYICKETKEFLKSQTRRDDSGKRLIPPTLCGIDKLYDYILQEIKAGRLSWIAPLFRFEGDDPQDVQVIHTGGFTDQYVWDKLDDSQKEELKKARISGRHAWKESGKPKGTYLFRVVDLDDVSAGVQIATETSLLGDKVKIAIKDSMKSRGEEAGNPFQNPFAITWEFNESEKEYNKKYHAFRNDTCKITPAVMKLLNAPPPDVSEETKPYDSVELGTRLAKQSLIKGIPFEEFFTGKEVKKIHQVPEQVKEEHVACDKCGKLMPVSATVCNNCGARYEVEEEAPKPLPTRSEMKKRSQATQTKPVPPATHPDDEFGSSDDIPF